MANERVEFSFGSCVAGREPAKGRWLVMTEVIHAHVFETGLTATLLDERNDIEKCLALFFWSVRPDFVVLERAVGFFP